METGCRVLGSPVLLNFCRELFPVTVLRDGEKNHRLLPQRVGTALAHQLPQYTPEKAMRLIAG